MHELAIAEGILGVIGDIAGERRVVRISISAGTALALAPDSLAFSFQLVAQGTAADGAHLEVHTLDGDVLRVDEVEVEDGEVMRRPRANVEEPHHDDHDHRRVHPAWL
jgi:Hydrogenase/urease nickel incorporation, metallochaperone, hypA